MDVFKSLYKYGNGSKDVAKERLKLILIHDRANIPPQFLSMIKGDLIKVISDYAEIDEEGIEITINTGGEGGRKSSVSSLVASIPIKKVKSIGK
ncbi:MAG: cell division topological specificity factor MinE [Clostridiales bacterium]|nr:cell division topological specificity factor MinE [Clostridiales bacterium]